MRIRKKLITIFCFYLMTCNSDFLAEILIIWYVTLPKFQKRSFLYYSTNLTLCQQLFNLVSILSVSWSSKHAWGYNWLNCFFSRNNICRSRNMSYFCKSRGAGLQSSNSRSVKTTLSCFTPRHCVENARIINSTWVLVKPASSLLKQAQSKILPCLRNPTFKMKTII